MVDTLVVVSELPLGDTGTEKLGLTGFSVQALSLVVDFESSTVVPRCSLLAGVEMFSPAVSDDFSQSSPSPLCVEESSLSMTVARSCWLSIESETGMLSTICFKLLSISLGSLRSDRLAMDGFLATAGFHGSTGSH